MTEKQCALLEEWLGPYSVIADYSWPLQDTTVLHVSTAAGQFAVKASATSHHIRREIAAHAHGMPGPQGSFPVLRHASPDAGILVTEFLPGKLVEGTPAEHAPEMYRQAGALLAALHRPLAESTEYAKKLRYTTELLLKKGRGLLDAGMLARAGAELAALPAVPVQLVTTHGDYQPRNWLQDGGRIKVIDFGRADARPWVHDLVRLSHQQFLGSAALEDAFYEGYGRRIGPAEDTIWRLENLNQAIGTIVWAHGIGDFAFRDSGVAMLERVLADP
ncbi:aminoglycoside phosphotransferase family protein [Arthrobacter sp. SW1]|uniref:phosphotransferase family protein n=1 Tax=Arthrobacter sp. SW1 TaxID=1920889 RepID=UPI001495470A|nr:aminoglycoside phosphotransferase family protein [Arthrobacter sp. SW1]